MSGRTAPAEHSIKPIIAKRWSGRAIDPRPVDRALVLSMLEAARWAPSCFADEPWRFMLWDKERNADSWDAAMNTLVPANQQWARNAPILILVLADSQFSRNDKPNRWGQYDTGAATENLHLQGVANGLVVHQMGGFDADAVQLAFGIPDRFTAMSMIAVGHPGNVDDLDEGYRDGETATRARRPLSELVFEGAWDQPLIKTDE
ncbi:MAG: nitroreductase family protein [Lysobacterales bacterium]